MINRNIFTERDVYFMSLAIDEARVAFSKGEIPVGALLVKDGEIVSRAHNMKESSHDPTAHAELLAIRDSSQIIGDWRLDDFTLYVTKEPCVMCAGVILNSRVRRLIYGCRDLKGGAVDSLFHLLDDKRLSHKVEIIQGVLEEECSVLLRRFFLQLRDRDSRCQGNMEPCEKDDRLLNP